MTLHKTQYLWANLLSMISRTNIAVTAQREDARLFVPSASQAQRSGLNHDFTRALSQPAGPSVAGSSKHHYRQEWDTSSHASSHKQRTDSYSRMWIIMSAAVCTKVSSWVRPVTYCDSATADRATVSCKQTTCILQKWYILRNVHITKAH